MPSLSFLSLIALVLIGLGFGLLYWSDCSKKPKELEEAEKESPQEIVKKHVY